MELAKRIFKLQETLSTILFGNKLQPKESPYQFPLEITARPVAMIRIHKARQHTASRGAEVRPLRTTGQWAAQISTKPASRQRFGDRCQPTIRLHRFQHLATFPKLRGTIPARTPRPRAT